jgi:hypothetical protein
MLSNHSKKKRISKVRNRERSNTTTQRHAPREISGKGSLFPERRPFVPHTKNHHTTHSIILKPSTFGRSPQSCTADCTSPQSYPRTTSRRGSGSIQPACHRACVWNRRPAACRPIGWRACRGGVSWICRVVRLGVVSEGMGRGWGKGSRGMEGDLEGRTGFLAVGSYAAGGLGYGRWGGGGEAEEGERG